MKSQTKHKIIAFILSFVLVAVLVVLFFSDDSSEWNFQKIFSCVLCSIWIFFYRLLFYILRIK